MKDTKYKILAYFDNQSYRKLFNEVNSDYAENLQVFEQIYRLAWKDYSVGDIKNIIWCLVKRLRKKLNTIEDGAGNCIVSVRDIGYKFELNKENEQQ